MNEEKFRPASVALAATGLSIATFMQVLDTTIANVALPTIAGNLGVTPDQSTWVVTSFAVFNAIGLPLTGWLARRLGEVKLFLGAVLFFVLTSFLCGVAQTMGQLIIFRAFQGLVAAPLYPVAQALLLAIFPNSKRGSAFALLSVVITVAPITGPICGGWLTENFSWPWIFFINIPIGLLSAYIVYKQLGNYPQSTKKNPVDYVGLGFLVLGVGLLQVVLDKGNDLDWFASNFIIICTILSSISIAAFIIWELTSEHPIVNLRLFAYRNFTVGTLAFVFGFSAFFAINLLMPLWLQNHMGYTAIWAGLAIAPIGILSLIMAPLVGRYAHKLDMRVVASFAFIAMGFSCWMRTSFTMETSFQQVAFVQFWMGLGSALFFIPLNAISLSDLPTHKIADGSGLITFLRTLGASFATSLTIWIWGRRAIFHHAQLSEYITPFNIQLQSYLKPFETLTPTFTSNASYKHLNAVLTQQSYILSTVDYFSLMGYLFFALTIMTWFSKPPLKSKS